jgi:hypothetical protein
VTAYAEQGGAFRQRLTDDLQRRPPSRLLDKERGMLTDRAKLVRCLTGNALPRYTNYYTNAARNQPDATTRNRAQDLPQFPYLW